MPFTLFQGASSLQFMEPDGTITTLTLPTGVTLDASKVPRFAIFGHYVVVVNSPSRPITVDADGVVRVLTPNAPQTPPTTSDITGGSLSGTYAGITYTYVIFDAYRRIIAESPMSPPGASVTAASDFIRASNLQLSADTVNGIRLYRPTTGGTTLFQWLDLEGNVQTSVQDDLSDASLALVAAPTLGAPPRLSHIGEFRERLWGVSITDRDAVRYTETSKMYSWPSTNRIVIPREGSDDRGVTGILVRRDALAVARQTSIVEIKGDSNANFRVVKLSQDVGVEADDSVAPFKDSIFFVAKDGVYEWSDSGLSCKSDGKVRSWFTSDTYFNRSRLKYAVGHVDLLTNKYQVLLSAAGSSDLDRWIEYDIIDQTWWGPHKTDAFTPTWICTILDSNHLKTPVLGSSTGFFFKEQAARTDLTSTGIALDVDGKLHDMGSPDIAKYFGELSILSKEQASGTLTIIPYVGDLDAPAGTPISATMTLDRQRLRRLGTGRYLKLTFQNSTNAVDTEIYGYEIPFSELGRR